MSTSAAQHLAGHGVTVDQAHAFIFDHLDNLPFILSVADRFGVAANSPRPRSARK